MSADRNIGIYPTRTIGPAAPSARRIYHVEWIRQTFREHNHLSTVAT